MRTDLVRWIKDLGTLPEGVYDAITAEAKAARRRTARRRKNECCTEIVRVKVRGRFYYAHVFDVGWTLLTPKRRAAHATAVV